MKRPESAQAQIPVNGQGLHVSSQAEGLFTMGTMLSINDLQGARGAAVLARGIDANASGEAENEGVGILAGGGRSDLLIKA